MKYISNNIFEIRKYDSSKNLENRCCIICNREFYIPKGRASVITTCCDYCSSVALSLKKMRGAYVLCNTCDKPVWKSPYFLKHFKRHYCSTECKDKGWSIYYEQDFGEEKINTGRKKYYGANWLQQRRMARERDNYTCQKCGITEEEYGQELSVHHKTPFVYFETYKEANKLDNLLCVCEPCHRKLHSGSNHHHKFEKEKIVFNNELNTVATKQKDLAEKVVDMLFNSELSLTEISNISGMSYSGVSRIYRGERWIELYDLPACKVKKRSRGGKIKNESQKK